MHENLRPDMGAEYDPTRGLPPIPREPECFTESFRAQIERVRAVNPDDLEARLTRTVEFDRWFAAEKAKCKDDAALDILRMGANATILGTARALGMLSLAQQSRAKIDEFFCSNPEYFPRDVSNAGVVTARYQLAIAYVPSAIQDLVALTREWRAKSEQGAVKPPDQHARTKFRTRVLNILEQLGWSNDVSALAWGREVPQWMHISPLDQLRVRIAQVQVLCLHAMVIRDSRPNLNDADAALDCLRKDIAESNLEVPPYKACRMLGEGLLALDQVVVKDIRRGLESLRMIELLDGSLNDDQKVERFRLLVLRAKQCNKLSDLLPVLDAREMLKRQRCAAGQALKDRDSVKELIPATVAMAHVFHLVPFIGRNRLTPPGIRPLVKMFDSYHGNVTTGERVKLFGGFERPADVVQAHTGLSKLLAIEQKRSSPFRDDFAEMQRRLRESHQRCFYPKVSGA